MKHRRVHQGKRFDVSAWIPPQNWIDAAEDRTEGMVGYYIFNQRNGQRGLEDLKTLVRSAYLQGAQDAAMVAARTTLGANK